MSVSRRQFIATTAASAAALSLSELSFAQRQNTSDIRLAVVGLKGRGGSHIGAFAENIVAMCDVDEKVLHDRTKTFAEKQGREVEKYSDYRKLLEREDIDAVSIATPNHTHALIAVAAAQAGKDVYCEKPVSHNIWEGRQIVNAARKYNKIIQCGTQARSSQAIRDAVAYVQNGEMGKIRYVVGTCYKPRPSIGKLDEPLQIPASINYDLWCGPAKKEELYRPHLHYDWHWDYNTGNGDMGNQGIHQMDIARWFLGEDQLAPSVTSIGGRLGYDDAGNTANTQIVYFDYATAPLVFETRGLPRSKAGQRRWRRSMDDYRGSQIGVVVQCEKGRLIVTSNYSEATAYDNQGNVAKEWRDRSSSHFQNFLDAVVAREPSRLNAEIREGHLSSALCHMGNVSHLLGERKRSGEIAEAVAANDLLAHFYDRMAGHLRANEIEIDREAALTLGPELQLDPKTETFTNNDAANQLRAPEQREPFVVPDLEGGVQQTAAAG